MIAYASVHQDKRPVMQAMLKGAAGKCPNCGTGKLFSSYLKVNDACSVCGEEFFHHRADDAPPYLTILIVGHLLIGLMLHMEIAWTVPPMFYIYTFLPLAVILPLVLLPPIKGAVVTLQWANRMHGFDGRGGTD